MEASSREIRATGLSRTFKGGIEAVRGIDLSVNEGEIFGFLGPNGAGKSTTVRMLCTLLPPTSGEATVAGATIVSEAADVRRRIGVALQEIGLDPVQTGRELLELQCGLYGITGAEGRKRTDELLELVGLTEAADRRTKTYSGGMKRRLDLASSLVHRPSVLFLDEPTTGLDPASRLTVWEEVSAINAGGTTVFLTTQYLEEADVLANRVGIIDHGRIVAEGTPEALKAEISRPSVEVIPAEHEDLVRTREVLARFGEPANSSPKGAAVRLSGGEAQLAEVVRALDAEDIHVHHLQLHAPTLDDVFLAKTGRSLEGAGEEQPSEEAGETVAA
jgi:ABC-2 type transport system ATP-binding protein